MMGRRRGDQRRLFYEFHLDDRIPKNHLLRRIDVFVTAALLSRTTATSAVHPSSAARRSTRGKRAADHSAMVFQPARTAALRSGSRSPTSRASFEL